MTSASVVSRPANDSTSLDDLTEAAPRAIGQAIESSVPRSLLFVTGPTVELLDDAVATYLAHRRDVGELHVAAPAANASRVRQTLGGWLKDGSRFVRTCERAHIDWRQLLIGVQLHALSGAANGHTALLAADSLLNLLRILCARRQELHVVCLPDAGAATAAAYSALNLVGRAKDRFFVLTSTIPRVPTIRTSQRLDTRPHKTQARRVTWHLDELPPILAERPLTAPTSYEDIVKERHTSRRRLAEPMPLVLDARTRTLHIDGTVIRLPRLAFFWMFAAAEFAPEPLPTRLLLGSFEVDVLGRLTVTARGAEAALVEAAIKRLHRIFLALNSSDGDDFAFMLKRACSVPSPGLPSTVSRIKTTLEKALGPAGAMYAITCRRGGEGYQFNAAIKVQRR